MGAWKDSAERRVGADSVHVVGWVCAADGHRPSAIGTIRFKNRLALWSWVWDPELNFGEAYMSGSVEIGGDHPPDPRSDLPRLGPIEAPRLVALAEIERRPYRQGERPSATTISATTFYRLWLDREMVYTCAYFPTPDATLEDAQIAKMDLLCRKLHLKPGERVIEAGCGWGSLALFMARQLRRDGARFQHFLRTDRVRPRPGDGAGLRRSRRVRRG